MIDDVANQRLLVLHQFIVALANFLVALIDQLTVPAEETCQLLNRLRIFFGQLLQQLSQTLDVPSASDPRQSEAAVPADWRSVCNSPCRFCFAVDARERNRWGSGC